MNFVLGVGDCVVLHYDDRIVVEFKYGIKVEQEYME